MKITSEEVQHVTHLARLNLNSEELIKMTEQLNTILIYVEKLNELNTEEINPTTHAFSISNAFRDDKVQDSLSQEDALANAPKQDGQCFIVPRIL